MTVAEFVVHARRHVGEREPAGLRRDRGVKEHLEEHVTQFLAEIVGALTGLAVEPVDRLEELVTLLQQVPLERGVRLFAVPRAPSAQRVDEFVEAHELGRDRSTEGRDVQRGEVIGIHLAVEVGPAHLENPLVGESEVMHHGDGSFRPVLHGQLDVAQDERRIALAHQERARLPRGGDGELMTIDECHTGVDGVDPETRPCQVEKRQCWQHVDVDPVVDEQELHRAFSDDR